MSRACSTIPCQLGSVFVSRGRFAFGGMSAAGQCSGSSLGLALAGADRREVTPREGPLLVLTLDWLSRTSPTASLMVRTGSASRAHALFHDDRYCCACNVSGQEVVVTGISRSGPEVIAGPVPSWSTRLSDDIDSPRFAAGSGRQAYYVPWRKRLDAVGGLGVFDLRDRSLAGPIAERPREMTRLRGCHASAADLGDRTFSS